MAVTLDRWLTPKPSPSHTKQKDYGRIEVFIDNHEIDGYYLMKELSIDYNKLFHYFQDKYNSVSRIHLYLHFLDSEHSNLVQFRDLEKIGFEVHTSSVH